MPCCRCTTSRHLRCEGNPVDLAASLLPVYWVDMMVYMHTKPLTNNERLRILVEASGLTQAVALTVFNRGLGPAAYAESTWKAFFVRPDSPRFRPLKDELLAHAEKEFGKLAKRV